MIVTVIGAGAMGSAVASALLAYDEVVQVQVCDARARSLQELHQQIQNPRMRSFQVDARDINLLESILKKSDCVVGCAQPEMNPALAEMCLNLGIHFCNLGSTEEITDIQLALAEQARKKSVWIVPNCGLAPGLVNILCVHGVNQLDEVEAAYLRVGDVPLNPQPPFNFRIAWSADKIIDDYTQPVSVIEEGAIKVKAPLSGIETLTFTEPFSEMEAFRTAGGLATLTESLSGKVKKLNHKTIRWPGHASQMRFLLELGFGERRSIDVRTHLTYRDVLVRRLRQRLGGPHEDAVLLRVVLHGIKDGEKKTLVYEMIETYDSDLDVTAIKRCTSIPTAVVAFLIASNQIAGGGASPPEHVVPHQTFLDLIVEQGLNITTTWHDGYLGITDPEAA